MGFSPRDVSRRAQAEACALQPPTAYCLLLRDLPHRRAARDHPGPDGVSASFVNRASAGGGAAARLRGSRIHGHDSVGVGARHHVAVSREDSRRDARAAIRSRGTALRRDDPRGVRSSGDCRGAFGADYVQTVLFESVRVIAVAFIAGGVVMLVVERFRTCACRVRCRTDTLARAHSASECARCLRSFRACRGRARRSSAAC